MAGTLDARADASSPRGACFTPDCLHHSGRAILTASLSVRSPRRPSRASADGALSDIGYAGGERPSPASWRAGSSGRGCARVQGWGMERKWWTLVAVCVATFMLLLDVTIVNVALPDIERSLDSSFADLQWVVDAYALTLAALLLTGGSLADLSGAGWSSSWGSGSSRSPRWPAASPARRPTSFARGAQGIGGAFMFATALALLAAAFGVATGGPRSGSGAPTGGAVAVGPLAGGVLTEAFGWESIFFVNVPIGIAAIALALAKVDESRAPAEGRPARLARRRDVLGGAVPARLRADPRQRRGLGQPADHRDARRRPPCCSSPSWSSSAAAGRPCSTSGCSATGFVGASVAAFVLSAAMFSMFLYLTLYVQNILGYSALEAGLRFLPITILPSRSRRLGEVRRAHRHPLLPRRGARLVGVGLLLMGGLSPEDEWTALLGGFLVAGAGIGLVNPALATAAVGVVAAAGRHGLRDQLDLPAGGHRRRHRAAAGRSSSPS